MSLEKIILAIDEIQNLDEAISLVEKVGPMVYAVKIHNLYDKFGPSVVQKLKDAGAEKVWVDFKLYDIPNTARLRAENIEADIISVHASGGVEMMKQAVASGKEIFAVTALTSFSDGEVMSIYNKALPEVVLSLAKLAKEAGVSGVVCSPHEIKMLREREDLKGLKLVVPGIRSLGADMQDQSRVSTPKEALLSGADYLVIGRQVTQSEDPASALLAIKKELEGI